MAYLALVLLAMPFLALILLPYLVTHKWGWYQLALVPLAMTYLALVLLPYRVIHKRGWCYIDPYD